jgi:hypothetical protein
MFNLILNKACFKQQSLLHKAFGVVPAGGARHNIVRTLMLFLNIPMSNTKVKLANIRKHIGIAMLWTWSGMLGK